MSMREPLTVFRSDKTDNDDGTYDEAAPSGPSTTVFGNITVHQNETVLIVDRFEDIKPEDIITSEDAGSYRVMTRLRTANAPDAMFKLERETRPITP